MSDDTVTIQDNLDKVNATLNEYVTVQSRNTTSEVLEKKGRDLAIQLFRGFWALRQKVAAGLKNPADAIFSGPMFTLARKRGWATKLRTTELEGPYAALYASGQAAKFLKKGVFIPSGDGNRALTKPALLIAQELATRQRGAGLLGVSFLSQRWRNRSAAKGGNYLVKNTSSELGDLTTFEQQVDDNGNGFFRLTNKTPGIGTVDGRKGIINAALDAVRADMLVYLIRKQAEAMKAQLKTIKPLT